MKFINLTEKEMQALIVKIGRSAATFNADVQKCAVQAIAQSIIHSNITPANQLYAACGKSVRRDSLIAYMEKFGNFAWSKKEDKMLFFKRETLIWSDEYAEQTASVMWYNAKPEAKPVSSYDADKIISDTLDRLVKLSGKAGVEMKNRDLLTTMVNVYNRHAFEKFAAGTKDVTTEEADQKDEDHKAASAENLQRLKEKLAA